MPDLSRIDQTEAALRKTHRALKALSACNTAIVRSTSEAQLLSELCRAVVEDAGYRMAWVGYAEHDEQRSVRPVAEAGYEAGYLSKANITWSDTERGRGPTGIAIRERVPAVCQDVMSDPAFAPWREDALARGYAAVVGLPLVSAEEVFGALLIYAADADAFDADEMKLLTQLAEDLAYGIGVFRGRERYEQAVQRLRDSEQRFRNLVEATDDWIWEIDERFRYTYVSPRVLELLGYEPDELIGKTPFDLMSEEEAQRTRKLFEAIAAGRRAFRGLENTVLHKQGARVVLEASGVPFFTADGALRGYRGIDRDISGRKKAEEKLRLDAKVFESTAEGVIIADRNARIIAVNAAFTKITGYSAQEALGRRPDLLQSGRHDREFYRNMWASISETGRWQGEIWNRAKSGQLYPEWLNISAVKDESGELTNYVAVFSDISAIKESELKLDHLAHHDPLTGLPNRLLLNARMEQALKHARRDGAHVAVLFIDLDRFKAINDSLGHPMGDQLLQEVAARLSACLREEDTVARLGGDEFVVLLEELREPQDAGTIAQKLLDVLARHFILGCHEVFVSASIGISAFPRDGDDMNTLMQRADSAMYRAKERGRGTYEFYASGMTEAAFERLALETSLRRAIERDQFVLHYQPQLDVRTGEVVAVEALLRWQHPDLGLLRPDRFLRLAEETHLMLEIGEWVLRTACRQLRQWLDLGLPLRRMSVNLAAEQLTPGQGLVQKVVAAMHDSAIDAHCLELEVAEGALLLNPDCVPILQELREQGVQLAVDDFGTGYSSISQLKQYPVQRVKIDRSFVHDLFTDPDRMAISRAMVAMAHGLSLQVTAEGVETREQFELLRALGCDEAQGFLFCHPMPADEFANRFQACAAPAVAGAGHP